MVQGNDANLIPPDLEPLYLVSREGYRGRIFPFTAANFTTVGIDLTVGDVAYHTTLAREIDLGAGPLDLYPGDSALIDTAEKIDLPPNYFGQVVPKLGLATKGISQEFATKIDFGFGLRPLQLLVHNTSNWIVTLKRGEPICGVILFATRSNADPSFDRNRPMVRPTLQPPLYFSETADARYVEQLERRHSREIFNLYQVTRGTTSGLDTRFEHSRAELLRRLDEILAERSIRVTFQVALAAVAAAALGVFVAALGFMLTLIFEITGVIDVIK